MASMASTRTACETSSADLSAGSKSITTASTSCSACRRSMATDHPGLAHQPVELVIGNIVQASVLRRCHARGWRNALRYSALRAERLCAMQGAFGSPMLRSILLCLLVLPGAAAAQSQVTVVIGYPPGAIYDAYGRLVPRHIGKHFAGNPTG